ncbi:unnamed protein product [Tuber aestivum]|uniref:Uncharacterized protein n=1 Tax=Tuber aestivum TaxID=59557 RepID=A0A292PNU4_9PEZI|nr:unnamed protein product [Tuber aestivum]
MQQTLSTAQYGAAGGILKPPECPGPGDRSSPPLSHYLSSLVTSMHFSARIISTALLVLTSPLPNSPIWANAARYISVPLRIEGPSTTIFEGTIKTSGHIVTTASGGTHQCDSVSNGEDQTPNDATPGGTITTAIDDAVSTWDGTWSKKYQDYFITSIAGYGQTQHQFWGLLIDYEIIGKGGCEHKLVDGQNVLVAFDAFGASAFLTASVNIGSVPVGGEVIVTVVGGSSGTPVEHAEVLGARTGGDGTAKIKFDRIGEHKFKATKDGTIRSNQVKVTVTRANAPRCANE